MMAEKAGQGMERSFGGSCTRGLHTPARGNAPACGYSATITASLGILSAVVRAIAPGGFEHRLEDEPGALWISVAGRLRAGDGQGGR